MNPMIVARNAANRRAAEANVPVYTTTSPEPKPDTREHMIAVEIENDYGYRSWSHVPESNVRGFICAEQAIGSSFSDQDHSFKCWCMKG